MENLGRNLKLVVEKKKQFCENTAAVKRLLRSWKMILQIWSDFTFFVKLIFVVLTIFSLKFQIFDLQMTFCLYHVSAHCAPWNLVRFLIVKKKVCIVAYKVVDIHCQLGLLLIDFLIDNTALAAIKLRTWVSGCGWYRRCCCCRCGGRCCCRFHKFSFLFSIHH